MFKNMKIGLRLAMSFSLIIVLMIVSIVAGLTTINRINSKLETIVKVDNVRTQLAKDMIDNAREVALSVRGTLLMKYNNSSVEDVQKMKDGWAESWKKYHKNVTEIKELINKNDTRSFNLLNKIESSGDIAEKLTSKAIEMALTGNVNDATPYVFATAYPSVKKWIQCTDDFIKHEGESTLHSFVELEKLYVVRRTSIIIIGVLAIALTVVIVILLSLGITRPLNMSVDAANRIASGDLTIDLSVAGNRNDEIGEMIQAFSRMIEKIKEQMKGIQDGVNLLASSSSEILASTTQVASGSAETATAISETTTTVEEVRQAAQLSSQKASRVSENAQQVAQIIQVSQQTVEETINGMRQIQIQMEAVANTIVRLSEQSQQIGGIIALVTDVADQSNLLAVNASIEAAKAGEQGKGFAVVAQEIKGLAQQSKQATMQVRSILNDIQKATSAAVMATEQTSKSVENGVKQSTQVGESIQKMADSSNKAIDAAIQIVASSQQQVVGMDQIGMAMNNINQAGMENAASMVQAEKAAKGLNELGLKLKIMVEQYKI